MNRLKNVNIKAVLLGWLVDIGGTTVSSSIYLLALYIAILIRQAGMEGADSADIWPWRNHPVNSADAATEVINGSK
jgi:hypothetical protein